MDTNYSDYHTRTEFRDYDWWEENCSIIPPERSRLVLVGVAGAIIASISVVFNTFLFCILVSDLVETKLAYEFMRPLVIIQIQEHELKIHLNNIGLQLTVKHYERCTAYILLFPINLYMDYFASELLASAWWMYMRVIITTSHIFISASAFLIVAAAFEKPALLPISLRAFVGISPSQKSEFWFRSIITIILPFLLCFYLNINIIRRLRIQHQRAKLFRFATSEHRRQLYFNSAIMFGSDASIQGSVMKNLYDWLPEVM
ncbi:hypothetical protein DICVIV_04481 [Dictyocaulus viviparus]|uniref:G-protein coupled receptors family 1 profile domain-containing protein n=1 Tax=Dictyocaulus viviparus TaxID=29172 RepID=A0A0D8XXM1_DICVI|nr:hypothetical protein DICVIV_04481 [Dictyocaulus viviparus]